MLFNSETSKDNVAIIIYSKFLRHNRDQFNIYIASSSYTDITYLPFVSGNTLYRISVAVIDN